MVGPKSTALASAITIVLKPRLPAVRAVDSTELLVLTPTMHGQYALPVHGRPLFAKRSLDHGVKVKIAPVHSDFRCETRSLSLMGLAGRRLDRLHAL
jgi:hypothetical protein